MSKQLPIDTVHRLVETELGDYTLTIEDELQELHPETPSPPESPHKEETCSSSALS